MLYAQAIDEDAVYEIGQGVRHHISKEAWLGIQLAHTAAGLKLPYSKGKLTKKQMAAIPLAKS